MLGASERDGNNGTCLGRVGDSGGQLLVGVVSDLEAFEVQDEAAGNSVQAHTLGGTGALLAAVAVEALLPLQPAEHVYMSHIMTASWELLLLHMDCRSLQY